MKTLFISIVSHNSLTDLLNNFSNFPKKTKSFIIYISIIDNLNQPVVKKWCKNEKISYFSDGIRRGFGANHNMNFNMLSPKIDDFFLVLNPDVIINRDNFDNLLINAVNERSDIYGVKVYESVDKKLFSSHNRSYPGIIDPLISLIFKIKLYENEIDLLSNPDWIGGAFMLFKADSYKKIKGFDENFFMYYEDTDICLRANKLGMKITYNPQFHIIHLAKREGRRLLSKNFFYNLNSYLKFFIKNPTFKLISIK